MKDLVKEVRGVCNRRKKDFLAPHVIILTVVSMVILCANIGVMYRHNGSSFTDRGFTIFMESQIAGLYPVSYVTMCLVLPSLITISWVKRRKSRQDWLCMTRLGYRRTRKDERMVAALTGGVYAMMMHVSVLAFLVLSGCPFKGIPNNEGYTDITRYFCQNQVANTIIYIIMCGIGFALFALVIDDICALLNQTVLVRLFGILLGIGMYVIPCLAQAVLPWIICEMAVITSLLVPSAMIMSGEVSPLLGFILVTVFYTLVDRGLIRVQEKYSD